MIKAHHHQPEIQMHLHPHQIEEAEYQAGPHPSSAQYDADEARMGAAWNDNWQDEFLLTSRDVWITNPGYHGPASLHHPEDVRFEEDAQAENEYEAAYAEYWKNESLCVALLESCTSCYASKLSPH